MTKMMAMKKIIISPVIVFLLLAAIAPSCRRGMCCGPLMGNISCIKGTDTVYSQTNPGSPQGANIIDSLNYYQGNGYTCTSNIVPFIDYGSPVYGIAAIRQQEAAGNGCMYADEDGGCDY